MLAVWKSRISVNEFNNTTELNGATSVKTVVLGGETYVYLSAVGDAGIQILKLNADGSLDTVGIFSDTNLSFLNSPSYFDIAEVGNRIFLVVPSRNDDGLTTLEITRTGVNQGQLTLASSINNGGGDALDYADQVEVFTTANGTFAAVTAYYSDAVSVYRIANNGALTQVDVELDADDAANSLGGAAGLTIMDVGNKTFLYVASQDENGLSTYELRNNGNMVRVDVQGVGAIDVVGIEAGTFNGQDYLIMTDSFNGEFEIFRIGNDGIPVFASTFDAYVASGDQTYEIYFLDIIQIDGVDFIISQGNADDSVSIYTINDQDQMELVQVIRDASLLNGANDVDYVQIGSKHFILATANDSNRITAIEVGGQDDVLVGTAGDDRIVGLNGDDDLIGRGGDDLLKGGDGDDVLSGRSGDDDLQGGAGTDVLIGGGGRDILEGGMGADFLLGGAGSDTASYASSSNKVNINLGTGFIALGDAQGDTLSSIENLIGTDFNDKLSGSEDDNFINGGDGRDSIIGADGDDRLLGGDGHDAVFGGAGSDTLVLGQGRDIGNGGAGDDTINGGSGQDTISGGGGDDKLNGSGGQDRLDGGTGSDELIGGGGADVFVFATNDGSDEIVDFEDGIDRIDFSNHAGFTEFSDVTLFSFGGNTVIGSGANTIVLTGFDIADMDASDFIF